MSDVGAENSMSDVGAENSMSDFGAGNSVSDIGAGNSVPVVGAGPAEVVVVGPAPPLRGGIAAHTARMIESLQDEGRRAKVFSYRRLYPAIGFPGRTQRGGGSSPAWSQEVIDVLAPSTWRTLGHRLAEEREATVVLQWWHPAVAPALLLATRGVDRRRLVAVCHNVLPHEWLPGSTLAARTLLGRCGRIVCHSNAQAGEVRHLLGDRQVEVLSVPLPPLVRWATCDAQLRGRPGAGRPRELDVLPDESRLVVAAGHPRTYKALDVLVSAWTSFERPRGARLLLVGESYLRGGARRRLASLVAGDESIVIVDRYVEDAELVSFLAAAEVVVAAHRRASQSGVVALARALGVATVVSDAGGLAEQDRAARVVPAGNVAALARALGDLLAGGRTGARVAGEATGSRSARGEEEFRRDWRFVIEAIVGVPRP